MIMTTNIKRYSDVIRLKTFEKRFEYLKLGGGVAHETFGGYRYLNQLLYHSTEWKKFRREIIIRDDGCDLADPDYPIARMILIHHLNPITIDDIRQHRYCVYDPENVICCSLSTHNAIHYREEQPIDKKGWEPRYLNDTIPWR